MQKHLIPQQECSPKFNNTGGPSSLMASLKNDESLALHAVTACVTLAEYTVKLVFLVYAISI